MNISRAQRQADPRLVVGLEQEYGSTTCFKVFNLAEETRVAFIRLILNWASGGRGVASNRFLINGDRLYQDVGTHLEHATSEEHSISRTVMRHYGFDHFLKDWLDHFYELSASKQASLLRSVNTSPETTARIVQAITDGRVPFQLFKNNGAGYGPQWGSHQNFEAPRISTLHDLKHDLLPFRVVLHLLTGAGQLDFRHNRPDRSRYLTLTQRARDLEVVASDGTTRKRPIFNLRDEPHGISDISMRVHLIDGDANISHMAKFVGVGLTRLIIGASQVGKIPEELHFPIFSDDGAVSDLRHPVAQLHALDLDTDVLTKIILESGKSIGAITLLDQYIDIAADFVVKERDTPENWQVVESARFMSEGLKDFLTHQRTSTLAGAIDWVTKKARLDTYLDAKSIDPSTLLWNNADGGPNDATVNRLTQWNAQYHAIARPPRGVNQMWNEYELREIATEVGDVPRAAIRALAVSLPNSTVSSWSNFEILDESRGLHGQPLTSQLSFKDPLFPDASDVASARRVSGDNDLRFLEELDAKARAYEERLGVNQYGIGRSDRQGETGPRGRSSDAGFELS